MRKVILGILLYVLANIMDDSVITCYEIIGSYDDETKTVPTNFNKKKCNL